MGAKTILLALTSIYRYYIIKLTPHQHLKKIFLSFKCNKTYNAQKLHVALLEQLKHLFLLKKL